MSDTSSNLLPEGQGDFDRWWFKVENRINSDLRFARLSCSDLGMYIRLLAVANMRKPGRIDAGMKDIAFTVRVSESELLSALEELKGAGLVAVDAKGLTITEKDVHYQGTGLYYSDSREGWRERQARKRERDKSVRLQSGMCHGDTSPARVELTTADEDQTGVDEEHSLALKEEGTIEESIPESFFHDRAIQPLSFDDDELEFL